MLIENKMTNKTDLFHNYESTNTGCQKCPMKNDMKILFFLGSATKQETLGLKCLCWNDWMNLVVVNKRLII